MIRHEQKRTQWQALVAEFEGSGRSQAEFAALAGVGLPAFRYWLYKLRAASGGRSTARPGRRPSTAATGLRLLPVDVQRAPATATGGAGSTGIEVDVASLRVRVVGTVDPAYVASLVGALRETGRC